eukprot:GFYU01002184.1.p1 GENE.GFYU01002184.1~~GFYU01002184.1.p1  ORF type:complete len:302 (+),score=84.82 GFYU01002184.1:124-1029(+)
MSSARVAPPTTFDALNVLTDLSEEQIHRSWRVFTTKKDEIDNGRRLENAYWRLWFKSRIQQEQNHAAYLARIKEPEDGVVVSVQMITGDAIEIKIAEEDTVSVLREKLVAARPCLDKGAFSLVFAGQALSDRDAKLVHELKMCTGSTVKVTPYVATHTPAGTRQWNKDTVLIEVQLRLGRLTQEFRLYEQKMKHAQQKKAELEDLIRVSKSHIPLAKAAVKKLQNQCAEAKNPQQQQALKKELCERLKKVQNLGVMTKRAERELSHVEAYLDRYLPKAALYEREIANEQKLLSSLRNASSL